MPEDNKNTPSSRFNSMDEFRAPSRPVYRPSYSQPISRTTPKPSISEPVNKTSYQEIPPLQTAATTPLPPQPQFIQSDIEREDNLEDLLRTVNTTEPTNFERQIKEHQQVLKQNQRSSAIYWLIVFSAIFFAVSFLNSASTHFIYTGLLFINLGLAVSLLNKNKKLRLFYKYSTLSLLAVSLVFLTYFLLSTVLTSHQLVKDNNYIKSSAAQNLSYQEKVSVAAAQSKVFSELSGIHKAEKVFYLLTGAVIIESLVAFRYLSKQPLVESINQNTIAEPNLENAPIFTNRQEVDLEV